MLGLSGISSRWWIFYGSERWCSFLLELTLFGVFPISPPVDGFCIFRAPVQLLVGVDFVWGVSDITSS